MLYVGVSDAPAWWIARANTLAELRGWTPFVGLQIEYSLIERTVERELIPMAAALGLGVTAWSPLSGGMLTGKYRRPTAHGRRRPGGSRYSDPSRNEFKAAGDRIDRIVAAVLDIAKQSTARPPRSRSPGCDIATCRSSRSSARESSTSSRTT